MKSKWKIKYIAPSLLRKKAYKKIEKSVKKLKYLKIWERGSIIDKRFLGKKVGVYNGKMFICYTVSKKMIGHKFGEFSFTKRMGSSIHLKKKKLKKNKNKK